MQKKRGKMHIANYSNPPESYSSHSSFSVLESYCYSRPRAAATRSGSSSPILFVHINQQIDRTA